MEGLLSRWQREQEERHLERREDEAWIQEGLVEFPCGEPQRSQVEHRETASKGCGDRADAGKHRVANSEPAGTTQIVVGTLKLGFFRARPGT